MAESSTEHKDLLVLQSLVSLVAQANTLPEMVLLLQQFLAIRPSQLRARHLLRSIEIVLYEQTSRLSRSVTHLKAQTLLARSTAAPTPAEKMVIIEEALALEPFSVKANLMLAQAAREIHNLPVAAFAYEIVCQEAPNERAHRHELGLLYEHTTDWIEARSVYHEILQADPDDLVAQEGMQRVLQQLQQMPPVPESASPTAESTEPELMDVQVGEMKGRLLQLKTQLDRYLRPPEQQQTISSQSPGRNQGQPPPNQSKEREAAIAKLVTEKKSLNLQVARYQAARASQDLKLQFELAQAYEDSELFASAITIFDKLRELDSWRDQAMVRLGACYIKEALQLVTRRRKEATEDPNLQAAPEAFPGEYSKPEQANWF